MRGLRTRIAALRDVWRARRELRPSERRLLEQALGAGAALVLPTRTRVDVGHWLSRGRLWLAWADDTLVLFAAGKRPFVEKLPAPEIAASLYNPLTAELVLLPAVAARQRKVRIAPVEGRDLLERMRQEDPTHA